MHSKKDIENSIREAVQDVTGITQLKLSSNLIDKAMKIVPVDFLYIFDMLEKKLEVPVHDIFINQTFEVMTVGNLTDALFKLENREYKKQVFC